MVSYRESGKCPQANAPRGANRAHKLEVYLMSHTLIIDRGVNLSEAQERAINFLIDAHNNNLFDANNCIEEEFQRGEFTEVTGAENLEILQFFSRIVGVLNCDF